MWMIVARPQVRISEHGCSGGTGWFYEQPEAAVADEQRKEAKAKKQRKKKDERRGRAMRTSNKQ
jgi:hypothetical protein